MEPDNNNNEREKKKIWVFSSFLWTITKTITMRERERKTILLFVPLYGSCSSVVMFLHFIIWKGSRFWLFTHFGSNKKLVRSTPYSAFYKLNVYWLNTTIRWRILTRKYQKIAPAHWYFNIFTGCTRTCFFTIGVL